MPPKRVVNRVASPAKRDVMRRPTRINRALADLFKVAKIRWETDGRYRTTRRWRHVDPEVAILGDDRIAITHIETLPKYRRRGLASKVLIDMCAWADRNDVTIELEPHCASLYGGEVLDSDQLAGWYTRYGFAWLDETVMIRRPNPVPSDISAPPS
jgi:GNAT superfamily N-acetyltransferase